MKTKKKYIAPEFKWHYYRTENGFGLSLNGGDGDHINGQEIWTPGGGIGDGGGGGGGWDWGD